MKYYHKLIFFGALLTALWSSTLYILHNSLVQVEKEHTYKIALREAEVAYEKDLTYRHWVSGLGGLYAEISPNLLPNDFLKVTDRDVATTNGKNMTMINPAYMMRMVYSMMNTEAGLHAHITSLNPIRPSNKPVEWEKTALKQFNNNNVEFHEMAVEAGKPVLRFMRAMVTEKPCLKCHAYQGYVEGDIRGGISVVVPMSEYQDTLSAFSTKTDTTFLTIWIVGVMTLAICFIALGRNERARRFAEKELGMTKNYLANIINSMPSVLVGVDRELKITHWNTEAEKISGLNSKDALGLQLEIALPEMQGKIEKIHTAMKDKVAETDSVQTRTAEGMVRYEEITIYPLISNGSQGAVIRIDDVTQKMQFEQMIIQSEKMLSVGGLAAGMAHEINNPLAGILGHAQNIHKRLLADLKLNKSAADECGFTLDQLHRYLKKRKIPIMLNGIFDCGNRAAKIVANMLNFSRKSESKHGSYHLEELLDKTIELAANDYNLKKHYDFRKIEIVRQYSENMPPVVCSDNEIQQVFLNLLKNGAEAMSEKEYHGDSPKFICRIREENDMAVVEIEDNGPGIDLDLQKKIFDPFYTSKSVGLGTGLGLSISYFIIKEQHEGALEVNSVPGEWTRFTIRLPIP